MRDELRVEVTPSNSFVLKRKINGVWNTYFSIAGKMQKSCTICGYPLRSDENCSHHQGLTKITIPYALHFVGYYQTDLMRNPRTDFTNRILEMKKAYSSEKYFHELFLLLNSLFEHSLNDIIIDSGTWVPTTNTLLRKIAKEVIQVRGLDLINSSEIFCFNPDTPKRKDLKLYVKEKYTLRDNVIAETIKKIKDKNIVIFDDVIHSGHTIGRIFKLIAKYTPSALFGLFLSRTNRGKHPAIISYPNLP